MVLRKLGNSSLNVSPLCFGGNVFGWTINEEESFKILDAFTDLGMNFIDTANSYSRWAPGNKGGESETIIGKWLRRSGKRGQIVLATKVGSNLSPEQRGLAKTYIKRAVEESLQRLQTDYIDLYQSHYDDPETPIAETLEAFAELIAAGKVRVIGASNFTGQRFAESLDISKRSGLPRYESLQPEYNLYSRERYETEFEQIIIQENIAVIPYYSLASGFLSGKYRTEADLTKSARGNGIKTYLNERGYRILEALDSVSSQYQVSPATVALSWLMARPGITAPIANATSIVQLHELVKATEITMDTSAMDLLTEASAY